MLDYFKKRTRVALDLTKLAYGKVVKGNFWHFGAAVFLGGLCRGLHILTFVLILQMLVMAVLPSGKRAEMLTRLGHDALAEMHINMSVSPAVIVGLVVLIVLLINATSQFFYQRLTGRIINNVNAQLEGHLVKDRSNIANRLKTATTMSISSIKITEITGFMMLLIVVIGFISLPILLVCLLLCGLAVFALLFMSPRRLRMQELIADSREAFEDDKQDASYVSFLKHSEELRFRSQFSGVMESFVVGLATILLVVFIQFENIQLTGAQSYQILFLVFSVRYAFTYMRELSRSFGQLFDLRRSII